jgi:uncharacterized protein (TIGR03435 family)
MANAFNKPLVAIAITVLAALAAGQNTTPAPEFEVASIRAAQPPQPGTRFGRAGPSGGPGSNDPTRYNCQNCPLSLLVSQAYDLKRFQLNAPAWMDTERYDVNAKVPDKATKEQLRLMIQRLLAERFKLVVHHEPKEMTSYELVVGKNGPKLKETDPAAPPPEPPTPGPLPKDKDGFAIAPPGAMVIEMTNGEPRATLNAVGETMAQLANRLSNQLNKPVFDRTGLTGKYDFLLRFSPDIPQMGAPPPGAGGGPPPPPPPPDIGPGFIAAVQSQLGLKLESKKGPVDVLVVDHMEKTPTEN